VKFTQSITMTKIVRCAHDYVGVIGGSTHWWTPAGQISGASGPLQCWNLLFIVGSCSTGEGGGCTIGRSRGMPLQQFG